MREFCDGYQKVTGWSNTGGSDGLGM